MLRCYDVTLTMLRCYDVTLLQCYDIKMLRCYDIPILRSFVRSYDVTMFRPRVDFLYVPTATRPLSHGITAAFVVLLYTERNEAVKSWNQGHPIVSELFKGIFVLANTN